MAKYLWSREKNVPKCTICGRIIPFCGPGGIEIDTKEIRHCYFCGSSMELFIYPKVEGDIEE